MSCDFEGRPVTVCFKRRNGVNVEDLDQYLIELRDLQVFYGCSVQKRTVKYGPRGLISKAEIDYLPRRQNKFSLIQMDLDDLFR